MENVERGSLASFGSGTTSDSAIAIGDNQKVSESQRVIILFPRIQDIVRCSECQRSNEGNLLELMLNYIHEQPLV